MIKKHDYLTIVNDTNFVSIHQEILNHLKDLRLTFKRCKTSNIVNDKLEYSYFYLTNPLLNKHKCRLTIIFNHQTFVLQLWLVAQNKKVYQHMMSIFSEYQHNEFALCVLDISDNFINEDIDSLKSQIVNLSQPILKTLNSLNPA